MIREVLGGAASSDTRQVLITGTNPFLQSRAAEAMAGDSLFDGAATNTMSGAMTGSMNGGATSNAGAARRNRPRQNANQNQNQQQRAAGRETVRPGAGATLTQAIGNLPALTGFAQIVGLAIGSPEFQRR